MGSQTPEEKSAGLDDRALPAADVSTFGDALLTSSVTAAVILSPIWNDEKQKEPADFEVEYCNAVANAYFVHIGRPVVGQNTAALELDPPDCTLLEACRKVLQSKQDQLFVPTGGDGSTRLFVRLLCQKETGRIFMTIQRTHRDNLDVTEKLTGPIALASQFIATSPMAVVIFDVETNVLAASNVFARMFGHESAESILGRHAFEVIQDLPEEWRIKAASALYGNSVEVVDQIMFMPDGTKRWFNYNSDPWYIADDEIGGIVVSIEETTQRKNIEADRQRLFDESEDLLFYSDAEGRLGNFNKTWTTLLGWDRDDIIKVGPETLVHPEDLKISRRYFERLQEGEGNPEVRIRVRATNGDYYWFEVTSVETDPGCYLFRMRDITEVVKADEAQQRGAAHLRNVLEHVPGGIFECRLEEGLLKTSFASSEFSRLHGRDDQEIRDRFTDFLAKVHPGDRPRVEIAILSAVQNFKGWSTEYRTQVNGATQWITNRSVCNQDQNGDPYWYGVAIDASEEKNTRRELKDTKGQFVSLFENAPIGFAICTGKFVNIANQAFRQIFECATSAEIAALESFATLTNPNHQVRKGAKRAKIQGRASRPVDVQIETAKGNIKWIRCWVLPIEWAGNEAFHYSISDITDQVRDKETLRKTGDEAIKFANAKASFLATMSHEIRTPLNSVIGMTQLLLSSELEEKQHRFAKLANESGKHLLSLVNNILDYSKIEAEKVDLNLQPSTLVEDCEFAVNVLAGSAEEKGLGLNLDVSSLEGASYMLDGGLMRQVLLNLISNAIKFTHKGEVTCTVGIRQKYLATNELPAQDYVSVEVSDTGVGIDKADIDRLFSEFGQANAKISSEFGGTGLGLSISRGLVNLMGGEITVESEVGKGSTFRFVLPLDRSDAPPYTHNLGLEVRASKWLDATPQLRGLVAEDNGANQYLIKSILEALGCECTIVANGLKAIEKLEESEFDFGLFDIQMPVMDGREAIQKVRETDGAYRDLPIIALTGEVGKQQKAGLISHGFTDMLPKPIDVNDLKTVLFRALSDEYQAEVRKTA